MSKAVMMGTGLERPVDAAWLGLACAVLVATGLGSGAGIEDVGQVLDFLSHTQPAPAGGSRSR